MLNSNEIYTITSLITGGFYFLYIAIIIISSIGMWKCFEKAGEKGWKAIIPFYNSAILYKISGMNPNWVFVNIASWLMSIIIKMILPNFGTANITMFYTTLLAYLILLAANIFELVLTILVAINFCRSFNKGGGYIAGMLLVSPIFYMIIGFGNAEYIGPKGIRNEETV